MTVVGASLVAKNLLDPHLLANQRDFRRELLARFHDVIALTGNSPRLVAMLTNLRELSTRYITHSVLAVPDRAQRANAEHEEILRAVVAHDPGAAADAVLRHLDGTHRALRTIRQLGAYRRDDGAPHWCREAAILWRPEA